MEGHWIIDLLVVHFFLMCNDTKMLHVGIKFMWYLYEFVWNVSLFTMNGRVESKEGKYKYFFGLRPNTKIEEQM